MQQYLHLIKKNSQRANKYCKLFFGDDWKRDFNTAYGQATIIIERLSSFKIIGQFNFVPRVLSPLPILWEKRCVFETGPWVTRLHLRTKHEQLNRIVPGGATDLLISTEYVIFTQWRQILSNWPLNYFQFRLLSQAY